MSNINVINNAGKDVNVTVNESENGVQIVIDLKRKKVELSSLSRGDVFKGNSDTEYILLDFDEEGDALVLRKDLLPDNMKFGDNNNFDGSDIDKYLNGTYLKEVEVDFGAENIVEQELDLTSMDGLEDYGKIKRKISLLPFNIYRKCRKWIGENMPRAWWLLDANSTPSGGGSFCVQYVNDFGFVCFNWYDDVYGVRPFLKVKSSIFVSSNL